MEHSTELPHIRPQWHPYDQLLGVAVVFVCLANIKSLPFMWHIRMLVTVCRRFSKAHYSIKALGPDSLYVPVITITRTPFMECDSNGHKGNSSYFTDLDISRSNLCNLLFGKALRMGPGPMSGQYFLALGGVACTFRREIMPHQRYEVWSRILSWDEKWLYVVSHFAVSEGRPVPKASHSAGEIFAGQESKKHQTPNRQANPGTSCEQKLFASAISRCVFKKGRITVAPEVALRSCGLLCTAGGTTEESCGTEQRNVAYGAPVAKNLERWEILRRKNLSIARLEDGWDKVHTLFSSGDKRSSQICSDIPWW